MEIGGLDVIIDVILCKNPDTECFSEDNFVDTCPLRNIYTICKQDDSLMKIGGQLIRIPSGCKCYEIER